MSRKKRVLIAPLDWGIGHATRDIPIIRELLEQGASVVVAADNRPYELLQKEFPQLEFVRLPGYAITYQKKGSFAFAVMMQVPKMFRSGFREHRWLKEHLESLQINAIISDNRFGLFNKKIPSVFITHQVGIIMPPVFRFAEGLTCYLNRKIINRYDECWIPDFEGENSLSGELAHKYSKPKNAFMLGPLTRFKPLADVPKQYDILVIMSGPEPQRTIMEEMMIQQLKNLPEKSLIVRGVPEESHTFQKVSDHLETISFMTADELNRAVMASSLIISRSGYSTVMDLAALGKKAIFIPTPGQTEQEHLAWEFNRRKIYYAAQQDDFNIQKAMAEVVGYSGLQLPDNWKALLKERVKALLQRIPD